MESKYPPFAVLKIVNAKKLPNVYKQKIARRFIPLAILLYKISFLLFIQIF